MCTTPLFFFSFTHSFRLHTYQEYSRKTAAQPFVPNEDPQSWWKKPSGHAGYWPSKPRPTKANTTWWTGDTYKLKSYKTSGPAATQTTWGY